MRPKERQGLTTGEVSRMLGITISTVIRYFDQGILKGWKSPITGGRLIDLKSVYALAKKSGIELPSKKQMERDLKSLKRKRKWAVIPVTKKEG